jgi:predicted N-acetyltransferase YhbS
MGANEVSQKTMQSEHQRGRIHLALAPLTFETFPAGAAMRFQTRVETPADAITIQAVVIAAFENAEHTSRTEHFIVRALRDAGQLTVSLVAVENEQIIGHVAISPVKTSAAIPGWYGLGPLSVVPVYQRRGVGTLLTIEALGRLRQLGAAGCVVLGDPAYYARFGFKCESSTILPGVPPEYFQVLSFDGALPGGTIAYHDSFFE